jgi:Bacterial PH domain
LRRPPIQQTEVSGIPCFWAAAPAPFTATLVFRVGRADETLPTAGITHLAEHILMPASPPRELDRNARVENIFAVFWVSGSPTQALRFLESLPGLIADPPLHRLETERLILRAEAASSGQHPVNASMALRYGGAAHGLMGFDELGLNTLGAEDVARWIGEYFTRENAALWLTGAPPRDLELELPSGTRPSSPEPVPLAEVVFPTVYPFGPDDTIVVAFDGRRSPALSMASSILLDRAWQTIRYDRGWAYDIGQYFEPIERDVAHGTLWVESLTQNVDVVRDALIELITGMADRGATPEQLSAELERIRDDLAEPAQLPSYLHYAACEHLLGRDYSEEEFLRGREAVTTDATGEAMRAVLDRLLIAVPSEERVPEGFNMYPMTSSTAVAGKVHRLRALPLSRVVRRTSLTVGTEGVTLHGPDGEPVTVLFRDVAAVVRARDGSRTLLGHDTTRLVVDPEDWRNGKEAVAAIDASVPDELVVKAEPEQMAVDDHVEEVAGRTLKRRWVVDEELALLPDSLDAGEEVLILAEASRGFRAGLLAATDNRLLWLYKMRKESRLEIAYDDIEDIRFQKKFLETTLEITTAAEKLSLSEIAPKERGPELEALVRERLATRGSPASA